jgi:hypothetical protein
MGDEEKRFYNIDDWLLQKNPDVKLRTNDPKYMTFVDRFLNQLYGRLSKHLVTVLLNFFMSPATRQK